MNNNVAFTFATSEVGSRLPRPTSCCPRKTENPPRCSMPTWKLTRVRRDGLSNRMAIDLPARGLELLSSLEIDLVVRARFNSTMVSLGVMSVTDRKSLLVVICRSLGGLRNSLGISLIL